MLNESNMTYDLRPAASAVSEAWIRGSGRLDTSQIETRKRRPSYQGGVSGTYPLQQDDPKLHSQLPLKYLSS